MNVRAKLSSSAALEEDDNFFKESSNDGLDFIVTLVYSLDHSSESFN